MQNVLSTVWVMCYMFHYIFCFSYFLFGCHDKIFGLIVSVGQKQETNGPHQEHPYVLHIQKQVVQQFYGSPAPIVGNPKSQKKILLAFLSSFWHPC